MNPFSSQAIFGPYCLPHLYERLVLRRTGGGCRSGASDRDLFRGTMAIRLWRTPVARASYLGPHR